MDQTNVRKLKQSVRKVKRSPVDENRKPERRNPSGGSERRFPLLARAWNMDQEDKLDPSYFCLLGARWCSELKVSLNEPGRREWSLDSEK